MSHSPNGSPAYQDPPPPKVETEKFVPPVKATVVNFEVDGCHWILELENGKKLQPLELDPKFQKDKLVVQISYTVVRDAMSNCMAGEIIRLNSIKTE